MSELMSECEHPQGDILGKCAICGDIVCGECYQSVFNAMVCSNHGEDLFDEGAWEMIGFYTAEDPLDERRYFLNEQNITTLVSENEDQVLELYVPTEAKEDAWEILRGTSEDSIECLKCRVFYSKEVGTCPMCGVGPETSEPKE